MANSSFSAMVLLMLVVAAAVFLLTPHERRSTMAFNPSPLWSAQR